MTRKLVSSLIIGCLAGGLLLSPMSAWADSKVAPDFKVRTEVSDNGSAAKVPLEKAIETAKGVFSITGDFDRFESSYNSYDGRSEWSLNWSRSKGLPGHISVRINAQTGELIGMDRWEEMPPGLRYSGLPKYTEDQAANIARDWLKKNTPRYFQQVKANPPAQEQQSYFAGERGPMEYYFNFPRLVNNVSFPENGIYIRINGDTGQVLGFNVNWDEKAKFPDAFGLIPAADANKVLTDNLELVYFRPPGQDGKGVAVKTVYRLKNGPRLLIDAFTGKVIKEDGYGFGKMGMGGGPMADKAMLRELTPAELAEVDKMSNLISEEMALEQLKKVIELPAGIKNHESRLVQDYQMPDQKQWQFNWYGQQGDAYYNLMTSVNALTGEVLSFDYWDKPTTPTSEQAKYNMEQAKQIAEAFIKKQQQKRFVETKLESQFPNDYIIMRDISTPRRYGFSYVRMVNGIPFPNNGFEIMVDSFTGEVTNYRMTWWEIPFPKVEGFIDKAMATDILLADKGLLLEYQRIHRSGQEAQLNLVYHLGERQGYMVDALAGTLLDWNGQVIQPKQTGKFKDISEHPAENDIQLLARAGIAKSSDGNFYPDRNITWIEAVEWLVTSRGWYSEHPYISHDNPQDRRERIIGAAIHHGIIENSDRDKMDQDLTRLEMARLLVNTLDYDGAAKLSGIFVLTARDAKLVEQYNKGFAALSLGLGLQTLDNQGMYRPGEKITRGFAASSVVRMLKVQK